jgi:hypothetical protein
MIRLALNILLILVTIVSVVKADDQGRLKPMIDHPEWYINVSDWSFYAPFGVGIIKGVTIENTGDITYKDVLVRLRYYSTSPRYYGRQISEGIGVLPVTVPPRSKRTYLKDGITFGQTPGQIYAGGLQVLGAIPVVE